jgi:hypothetical protein
MSTSTAFDELAACDRRTPLRKSPKRLIGTTAVALLVLASAWTVYVNVFASGIYPSVGEVNFEPVVRVAPTSFAERFEPAEVAPLASKKQNRYMALLDATYSLGFPSGTFSNTAPAEPEVAAVAPAPQEVRPLAVAPAPKLALNVPAPVQTTPRRAERGPQTSRGLGHGMLVQRARAAILAAGTASKSSSIFAKLFGSEQPAAPELAYASADGGVSGDGKDTTGSITDDDRSTAVYDISAKTVYMPDGSKLEAHSGLGSRLDDPRFVHERMHGATPPHIYDLKPREALFHGVPALRLNPVGGEDAIFGRAGLLAHTYMLGPNGDSNGCISFKDYNKFLQAYRNGDIKRLVVVASLN